MNLKKLFYGLKKFINYCSLINDLYSEKDYDCICDFNKKEFKMSKDYYNKLLFLKNEFIAMDSEIDFFCILYLICNNDKDWFFYFISTICPEYNVDDCLLLKEYVCMKLMKINYFDNLFYKNNDNNKIVNLYIYRYTKNQTTYMRNLIASDLIKK